MTEYKPFIALASIAGILISALLLIPAQSEDIFIIRSGSSNGTGAVSSLNAGAGIAVNQTTGNILITNTSPDNTLCTNVGTGTHVYKDGECNFKTLVGSADISVTNTSNTVVIDYNGTIDDTVCANVGTGSQIYKDGECNFRTVLGSSDISVTQQSNTITIDYNGSSSGVSSLTSANSAITLNASSGNVLITPKWQLLTQNTTVVNLGGSNVLVNQNAGTSSFLACVDSAGTTACAERLATGSVLTGATVNKMTVSIRKVSTPAVTVTICVMDNSANCLYTFGTIASASLTTSCASYSFTGTGTWTLSAGQSIGIKAPSLTSTQQIQTCATNPNQFDGTNSFVGQFFSGAWANATTWDLGATGATNPWILEGPNGTYINSAFTAKKHLLVTAELRVNGTSGLVMRMNNDTGANYSLRTVINDVQSTLTSKTYCDMTNSATIIGGDRILIHMWIYNNQDGDRKLINGVMSYGGDTGATTAPSQIDFTCKWANTSTQINSIVINGFWLSGTVLTVWGYD